MASGTLLKPHGTATVFPRPTALCDVNRIWVLRLPPPQKEKTTLLTHNGITILCSDIIIVEWICGLSHCPHNHGFSKPLHSPLTSPPPPPPPPPLLLRRPTVSLHFAPLSAEYLFLQPASNRMCLPCLVLRHLHNMSLLFRGLYLELLRRLLILII